MEDIELAIKKEFLAESKEMLEACEEAFIDLEQSPDDKNIMDSIFRMAHTIKGSGYAAGFDGLAGFVHKFEAVLSRLRSDQIELDSNLADVLLQANDKTKEYVDALAEDMEAEVDTVEVSELLEGYMDPVEPQGEPMPAFGIFDDDDDDDENDRKSTDQKVMPVEEVKQDSGVVVSIDMEKENPEGDLPATVLIVDDEQEVVELLSMSIEDLPLRILKAYDGEEGLKIATDMHVDLIVTDLKMPNMNGLEFVKHVNALNRNIPVVFCSGYADKKELIEFLGVGAYGFIEKPFDADAVKVTVRNGLIHKQMRDAMMRLSVLNFRAYMTVTQLARHAEANEPQKVADAKAKMDSYLDEISKLTNLALNPKQYLKKAS